MAQVSSLIRYAWAAPTTALGCVVVLAGLRRAQLRVVDGVLEAHGPSLAWLLSHLTLLPGGAAALTLGHVVIARDERWLESTRAHERVHVRQCEAWGPFFVPSYLAASLCALLRGRNFYFDNWFEVEAYHAARIPETEIPPVVRRTGSISTTPARKHVRFHNRVYLTRTSVLSLIDVVVHGFRGPEEQRARS